MTSEFTGARDRLETAGGPVVMFRLDRLAGLDGADPSRLPHTVKILLENLLRRAGSRDVTDEDVRALATWPEPASGVNVAFMPGRVLMQDFTGVPAVVDLAAMRSAIARAGGDPSKVNPLVDVDLIIDHSVQVDLFRSADAYERNIDVRVRAQRRAVRAAALGAAGVRRRARRPPGGRDLSPGQPRAPRPGRRRRVAVSRSPTRSSGTDSHTTMINGLGVLGWGVGGIEAEAAMLGQPMFLPRPLVVGVRVSGALPAGTTATDLVLTLTQTLRAHGVVGKFVEFFGDGCSTLELADRATLSQHVPRVRGDGRALAGRRRDAPIPAPHRARRPRRPRRALHEGAGAVPPRRRPRARVQRGPRPGPVGSVEPSVAGPRTAAGPRAAAAGSGRRSTRPSTIASSASARDAEPGDVRERHGGRSRRSPAARTPRTRRS